MKFTTQHEEAKVVRLQQDGDNVHVYVNGYKVASFCGGHDSLTIYSTDLCHAGVGWVKTPC